MSDETQKNTQEELQDEVVEMEDQDVTQEEKNIDYKDQWLRAQADYQNLQKETAKQKSEWAGWSKRQVLEEFIPVYENFKKAYSGLPSEENTSWENWAKGIEFIKKQFADILAQHGMSEMKTVGEMFDPEKHEAVDEEESDKKEGTILREVSGGYEMNGKVVIPAKVVVSKS